MDGSPYTRLNNGAAWSVVPLILVSFGFTGIHTLHQFPTLLWTSTGAYLLPYFLCLLWMSVPVLYVQFRLGGATGSNITGIVSKHLPILKGISISCGLRLMYGAIVHQVQTAIALYFLYQSFYSPPVWAKCDNPWNTPLCDDISTNTSSVVHETAESQFYRYHVVDISEGFFDTGSILGYLAVAMLVAWILTFLLVAWGPRAYAWLTALPVIAGLVVSFVMLGRLWSTSDGPLSSTLSNLLRVFYKPDWDKLTDIKIWRIALGSQMSSMFLWLGVVPTLGKYSGTGNAMSRGGWWFIVQAVVFVQHVSVCLFVPFIALQSSATPARAWNTHNHEELMFSFIPVSLRMLPDELWPRVITCLFYTYVSIFYLLQSALLVFVVVSLLVSGISALSGPKSSWQKSPMFRPIITAGICFVSYVLGIAFVSQCGYFWRRLSDLVQDTFLFVFVLIMGITLAIAFVRETDNYLERMVIGVWFVLASVVSLVATLFDGKPWEFLDRYKSVLAADVGGGTVWSGTSPGDGDNVAVVSYTIALGPLVWGLVIGAIHAVVSYNGPSELAKMLVFTDRLAVGKRVGAGEGYGKDSPSTRRKRQITSEELYQSFTDHSVTSANLHKSGKLKDVKKKVIEQCMDSTERRRGKIFIKRQEQQPGEKVVSVV